MNAGSGAYLLNTSARFRLYLNYLVSSSYVWEHIQVLSRYLGQYSFYSLVVFSCLNYASISSLAKQGCFPSPQVTKVLLAGVQQQSGEPSRDFDSATSSRLILADIERSPTDFTIPRLSWLIGLGPSCSSGSGSRCRGLDWAAGQSGSTKGLSQSGALHS